VFPPLDIGELTSSDWLYKSHIAVGRGSVVITTCLRGCWGGENSLQYIYIWSEVRGGGEAVKQPLPTTHTRPPIQQQNS
jgi:hypothetical protein